MEISYIEALKAMEIFLDEYYSREKKDDIGLLLSDISLDTFIEEKTADPAAWEDWEEAIESVKKDSKNKTLTEIESFAAMIAFVKAFGQRINSQEIKELLLEILHEDVNNASSLSKARLFWKQCLERVKISE